MVHLTLLILLCLLPGLRSALPMTDYSQLNHDEPTHWTKAATTESSATERAWRQVLTKVREHLGSKPRKHSVTTPPTSLKIKPSTNGKIFFPTETPRVMTHDEVLFKRLNYTIEALSKLSTAAEINFKSISRQNSNQLINSNEILTHLPLDENFKTRNKSEIIKNINLEKITTDQSNFLFSTSETSETQSHDPTLGPMVIVSGFPNSIDKNIVEEYGINHKNANDVNLMKSKHSQNDSTSEYFYRYDLVDDIKNLFTSDADARKEDSGKEVEEEDDYRSPEFRSPLPTYKTVLVHKGEDMGFDSEQEEEEMKKDRASLYDTFALPTNENSDDNYDSETPFKEWDRDSEEQEKILENIVFQSSNESNVHSDERKHKTTDEHSGRWFILLLAGNSTIVRLRQKDFAKYLKLNLAARLSLEYDELRVNRVVLAPPRLMVNVSVVPSEGGNLDEEFDLNERIFGEEEAPLHKLAETNATLLELSGEEYHVVRFLSLRSEQQVSLEEASSETSVIVSDRHTDIEKVIYIGIGGACIIVIIPLIFALCRLYVVPKKIRWPWKRDKPLFISPFSGPRHQRMEEPSPVGGPLTVIYSGSFVERNGPPSGSWLEDNYQNSSILQEEPVLENPVYGYKALNRTILSEICDPTILESPRFNIDSKLHILGCRPSHLLLPHTPIKRNEHKNTLDVRIPKGLDNPNYQT